MCSVPSSVSLVSYKHIKPNPVIKKNCIAGLYLSNITTRNTRKIIKINVMFRIT
jgi:hypothetical protein